MTPSCTRCGMVPILLFLVLMLVATTTSTQLHIVSDVVLGSNHPNMIFELTDYNTTLFDIGYVLGAAFNIDNTTLVINPALASTPAPLTLPNALSYGFYVDSQLDEVTRGGCYYSTPDGELQSLGHTVYSGPSDNFGLKEAADHTFFHLDFTQHPQTRDALLTAYHTAIAANTPPPPVRITCRNFVITPPDRETAVIAEECRRRQTQNLPPMPLHAQVYQNGVPTSPNTQGNATNVVVGRLTCPTAQASTLSYTYNATTKLYSHRVQLEVSAPGQYYVNLPWSSSSSLEWNPSLYTPVANRAGTKFLGLLTSPPFHTMPSSTFPTSYPAICTTQAQTPYPTPQDLLLYPFNSINGQHASYGFHIQDITEPVVLDFLSPFKITHPVATVSLVPGIRLQRQVEKIYTGLSTCWEAINCACPYLRQNSVLTWFTVTNTTDHNKFVLTGALAPPAVGHNITFAEMTAEVHTSDHLPAYPAAVGVKLLKDIEYAAFHSKTTPTRIVKGLQLDQTLYDMFEIQKVRTDLSNPREGLFHRDYELIVTNKVYYKNPYNPTQLLPITSKHFAFSEYTVYTYRGNNGFPEAREQMWAIKDHSNTTATYHLDDVNAPVEFICTVRAGSVTNPAEIALPTFHIPLFANSLEYHVVTDLKFIYKPNNTILVHIPPHHWVQSTYASNVELNTYAWDTPTRVTMMPNHYPQGQDPKLWKAILDDNTTPSSDHNFPPHNATIDPAVIDPLPLVCTVAEYNANINITLTDAVRQQPTSGSLDVNILKQLATQSLPDPHAPTTTPPTPGELSLVSVPFTSNGRASYEELTVVVRPDMVSPVDAVLDPRKTRCSVELFYTEMSTGSKKYRVIQPQVAFQAVTDPEIIADVQAGDMTAVDSMSNWAMLTIPSLEYDPEVLNDVEIMVRCHFSVLSRDAMGLYPLINNFVPSTPRIMMGHVLQRFCPDRSVCTRPTASTTFSGPVEVLEEAYMMLNELGPLVYVAHPVSLSFKNILVMDAEAESALIETLYAALYNQFKQGQHQKISGDFFYNIKTNKFYDWPLNYQDMTTLDEFKAQYNITITRTIYDVFNPAPKNNLGYNAEFPTPSGTPQTHPFIQSNTNATLSTLISFVLWHIPTSFPTKTIIEEGYEAVWYNDTLMGDMFGLMLQHDLYGSKYTSPAHDNAAARHYAPFLSTFRRNFNHYAQDNLFLSNLRLRDEFLGVSFDRGMTLDKGVMSLYQSYFPQDYILIGDDCFYRPRGSCGLTPTSKTKTANGLLSGTSGDRIPPRDQVNYCQIQCPLLVENDINPTPLLQCESSDDCPRIYSMQAICHHASKKCILDGELALGELVSPSSYRKDLNAQTIALMYPHIEEMDATAEYNVQQKRIADRLASKACPPQSGLGGYYCAEYPFVQPPYIMNTTAQKSAQDGLYYLHAQDSITIGFDYEGKDENRVTVSLTVRNKTTDVVLYENLLLTTTAQEAKAIVTMPTYGVPAFDNDEVVVSLDLFIYVVNNYYQEQQQLFRVFILNQPQPDGDFNFRLLSSCQAMAIDADAPTDRCLNAGQCNLSTGRCECKDNVFTFEDFCATNICSSFGCSVEGTTACAPRNETSTTPTCTCKSGFSGALCNQRECNTLRCVNNGFQEDCTSTTCSCVNQWSGARCQTCQLVCLNGGRASSNCDSCICPSGYVGSSCNCRSLVNTITFSPIPAYLDRAISYLSQQTTIPTKISGTGADIHAFLYYSTSYFKQHVVSNNVLTQVYSNVTTSSDAALAQFLMDVDRIKAMAANIRFSVSSDLLAAKANINTNMLLTNIQLSHTTNHTSVTYVTLSGCNGSASGAATNNVLDPLTQVLAQPNTELSTQDVHSVFTNYQDFLQNKAETGWYSYLGDIQSRQPDLLFVGMSSLTDFKCETDPTNSTQCASTPVGAGDYTEGGDNGGGDNGGGDNGGGDNGGNEGGGKPIDNNNSATIASSNVNTFLFMTAATIALTALIG